MEQDDAANCENNALVPSCRLVHHGASASVSSSHALAWIPCPRRGNETPDAASNSMIVYSSHGILNVASSHTAVLSNGIQDPVWHVHTTLRTSSTGGGDGCPERIITALAHLAVPPGDSDDQSSRLCLASGFSDGTVNLWQRSNDNGSWEEQILVEPSSNGRAITDLDGLFVGQAVWLVTCSSDGAFLIQYTPSSNSDSASTTSATKRIRLASFIANTVRLEYAYGKILILVGTAGPRHNKIHLYYASIKTVERIISENDIQYCGHLSGHQDWITSLDWHIRKDDASVMMLASASQDARIRLWRFATNTTTETQTAILSEEQEGPDDDDDLSSDEDEDEGESRLELVHDDHTVTRVTLEALLFGHEEAVTSVQWHPNPMPLYGQERILISSSMDRMLLVWGPTTSGGGVWTPLTRVGGAGGILGGSIGSTLLGFVNAAVEPISGNRLVGHAYGGSLHFWSLDHKQEKASCDEHEAEGKTLSVDEMASRNKWRAAPCLTGHFRGVTDLCWEAESGEYLVTVSLDQTCRLWVPVQTTGSGDKHFVWVELARPQVHGYDLTAATSISSAEHRRHVLVSGADEKELRVFDAPMTTVRMLRAVHATSTEEDDDSSDRVERAFIPSLGLSNKATAADGAEEEEMLGDNNEEEQPLEKLPLERDLGVLSLWPEVRKLYGHNTELFCLTSTVSARTGPKWTSSPYSKDLLVASSAKARGVEDASIRLWNVDKGKCIQVLTGGHRSTVASLSFSPDGRYLASSGKDRRLCIWRREDSKTNHRDEGDEAPSQPPSFTLGAAVDSAHKRIIWSVHFCPHEPTMLASGSRDGCIKIWLVKSDNKPDEIISSETVQIKEIYSFGPSSRVAKKQDSVTALAFAPRPVKTQDKKATTAILAVGVERGLIELWGVPSRCPSSPSGELQSESSCQLLLRIPAAYCHIATVTKLAWKPLRPAEENQCRREGSFEMTLASGAMDHGCRILQFVFNPTN